MKPGRIAFVAVEAVLLAAIPVLGWVGFQTVLDTTEGQAVDPELDPNEPGYEAFLEPTPVALTAGVDGDGALSWVTVVSLGGPAEEGGAVLFVPPATRTRLPDLGSVTIAEAWVEDGQTGLANATGEVLGAGFSEVVVLEPARVVELLAPASPLPLVINDELPGFYAGDRDLSADEVADLLGLRVEGESDLARLARHEDIWRSWLAAVAASTDPDVVPGERSSGMGRYVRGLAAGAVSFDTIPVDAIEPPEDDDDDDDDEDEVPEEFEANEDAVHALVADRIPFPVAPRPGERLRVRVLDGVGVDGLALRAARDIVRAGGQVTVIGNADRFDAETSRFVYFDANLTAEVQEVAEGFGIDDIQRNDGPNPNDLVDLTVVVGRDVAAAYGLSGG